MLALFIPFLWVGRYYAQISCDSAARRLEEVWKKKLKAEYKNDLIEPERYLSGYA